MNNKIANAIAFSLGAAIGAVVTWRMVKTKYERIAQEEIDSVKKAYSKRAKTTKEECPQKESEDVKLDDSEAKKKELKEVTTRLGYSTIPTAEPKPYVISPDNFGDGEYDYELVSLVYYEGDDTLVKQDEVIHNIDDIIGLDSLMHFGDYEEDVVHVRNDRLKTDYEVFLNAGKWSEVSDSEPDEDE